MHDSSRRNLWQAAFSLPDHDNLMQELAASATVTEDLEQQLIELKRETALLQLLADQNLTEPAQRILFFIRPLGKLQHTHVYTMTERYKKLFAHQWGLEIIVIKLLPDTLKKILNINYTWDAELLIIKGRHAEKIARLEEGTHLFINTIDNFVPLQVMAVPLADDEDAMAAYQACYNKRDAWLEKFALGEASIEDDPLRLMPVIRIYDEKGLTLDLRTGLIVNGKPEIAEMRAILLTALSATSD